MTTAEKRKGDPNGFWKDVKCMMGRRAHSSIQITDSGTRDGRPLQTDSEIEQHMRDEWVSHFARVPETRFSLTSRREMDNLFRNNPGITKPHETIDFTRLNPACEQTKQITPWEVYSTIKSMSNKAPGEDRITQEHLIHLPKIAIVNLAHIFSAALSCGYFPDNLKTAVMIFIPKPGKPKHHPKNYRPISLLPVPGKVYEKILSTRLAKFTEDNGHDHPQQYGFTRNRGTASALAISYEVISRNVNHLFKSRVTTVSFDIKGAFDQLSHRRMKFHLCSINLPSCLQKALCHFLDNRFAKIRIGQTTGQEFPLLAGTPQGAIPSTRLFNLALRLAPQIAIAPGQSFVHSAWYADDNHNIVVTIGGTIHRNNLKVTSIIRQINQFLKHEGLVTDPDKSWMQAAHKRPECSNHPTIRVNGHDYTFTNRPQRLLGLYVKPFSWVTEQVNRNSGRAYSILGILKRFKSAPTPMKMYLVKAFVLSVLMYPTVPLHTASDNQMVKLQAVQNAALKFAYNKGWPDRTKARTLHGGTTPTLPVNQVLHHRANKIWTSISEGRAGDLNTYNRLLTTPTDYNKLPSHPFPSSMDLAFGPPPPPIYSMGPNHGRAQNADNLILLHIRNIIRDKYLTANPQDDAGIG